MLPLVLLLFEQQQRNAERRLPDRDRAVMYCIAMIQAPHVLIMLCRIPCSIRPDPRKAACSQRDTIAGTLTTSASGRAACTNAHRVHQRRILKVTTSVTSVADHHNQHDVCWCWLDSTPPTVRVGCPASCCSQCNTQSTCRRGPKSSAQ